MTSIIKPTIGRIVHVHFDGDTRAAVVVGANGLVADLLAFSLKGTLPLPKVMHQSMAPEGLTFFWTWPPRSP